MHVTGLNKNPFLLHFSMVSGPGYEGKGAVSGHGQDPWDSERGNARLCSLSLFLCSRVQSVNKVQSVLARRTPAQAGKSGVAEQSWGQEIGLISESAASDVLIWDLFNTSVRTGWEAVPGEGRCWAEPVGVAPALAVGQALKAAGEEPQPHGAALEFGNVSRCYPVPHKERIMNLTRLGIWDKVILWKTVICFTNREAVVAFFIFFFFFMNQFKQLLNCWNESWCTPQSLWQL